jgi:polyhydroxybutyrate depolymerase
VLQVLLLVAGSSVLGASGGIVGAMHRWSHSSLEVLVLLFLAVPLIYAVSWVIASAVRRTPLSLPLTGREWRPSRKTRIGQARDRALDKIEDAVTGRARRVSRRTVAIAAAVAVLAAAGTITGVQVDKAATRTLNETAASIQVGSMTRSYTTLTPAKTTLPASAPIIVALSGLNANQPGEILRDYFLPYVLAGDAEVVYPLAYRESWNAIGCCSWAAEANIDDVDFIKDLVQKIDPGHARPIYLMGYSNGGRLAYTLACTDPLLFDGTAVVKSDPQHWCNISVPQKILQVSSTDDTDTPWYTGEKGHFRESPAAQVENAILR